MRYLKLFKMKKRPLMAIIRQKYIDEVMWFYPLVGKIREILDKNKVDAVTKSCIFT